MRSGSAFRRRSRQVLVAFLAAVVFTGCATPVGVRRMDPEEANRKLTGSVLAGANLSAPTMQILNRSGHADKIQEKPAEAIAAIMAGEDVITEKTLEYKLVDRQKAAIELAKHHGLYEKDNAQQKPDPTQIQFVNAPTPMSLEEWEKQAQEAHARMMARNAAPPKPETISKVEVKAA